MKSIIENFKESELILRDFISDENNFKKINDVAVLIADAFRNGNKVISCGNGGSMCDAMHFAEELSGRFRNDRRPLPAISISDPSHITCTANDYGYDFVFSRFIEAVGNKGDVILAISTSGNSTNIVNAAWAAKQKEMKVVGLTGKDGGEVKKFCDIEIRAPYADYADRAQEIHIKVIHSIIHRVEELI
jgi:D-sedoheptulose 7-phosphate isomerase